VKRVGYLVAVAGVAAVLGSAWANDSGTEAEARAMLERAIVALKEDKSAAFASF